MEYFHVSREFNKLLESKDKKVNEARNALAKIFRTFLQDVHLGPTRWSELANIYYKSRLSSIAKDPKTISQHRNNLGRGLAKASISWKRFMQAVFIARVLRVEITMRFVWPDRFEQEPTVVDLTIDNPLENSPDNINETIEDDTDSA